MKKVGIIDCYISNWHANTYHKLFHELAVEENREEYVITHIYASVEVSPSNNETTEEWCARTGAKNCSTIKEVCDSVDVIMVLAPNNPELHEELCKLPFESKKPVYVDKTFAPDTETAKRIISMGKENGVSFWSSSATRFEGMIKEFLESEDNGINKLTILSGNMFEIYSIHLIELANTFMKNGALSVICHSGSPSLSFKLKYTNGRTVILNQFEGTGFKFTCFPEINGKCKQFQFVDDFWKNFARGLLDFFDSKNPPIPIENTLECIAIRTAMVKARECIGTEIKVEL